MILALVTAVLFVPTQAMLRSDDPETVLFLGVFLLMIGIMIGSTLMMWVCWREGDAGLTWGRQVMGTRLVDGDTGAPIGFGRAIGRRVASGVITVTLLLPLHLWMIWDKRRQGLPDKVVRSVVVKV